MDIDLLSKMVKELILDNDKVCLPGMGSFVAEVVPSVFSDRGYTINPPYRRLSFRTNVREDNLLVDFYAEANGIESGVAARILKDFISELKSILEVKKNIVFPGLGRMRATKENNFFFVADEDLEIFPEGFGLEPVSLKTHVATRENFATAAGELKSLMNDPPDSSVPSDCSAPSDGSESSDIPPASDISSSGEDSSDDVSSGEVSSDDVSSDDICSDEVLSCDASSENISSCDASSEERNESILSVTELSVPDNLVGEAESREQSEAEFPERPEADSSAGTDEVAQVEETAMTAEVMETEAPESADASEYAGADDEIACKDQLPLQGGPDRGGDSAGGKKRSAGKIVMVAVLAAVGAAVLLLAAYLLIAYICPDFINSILYDAEELEVLKYGGQ
ncbi:MAG: hypothetical protein IAC07_01375 [Bacteroidetes bacterium]|uniref:CCDC81-like prokaryotic HU domain-containing protein n=1 Tax=Candidatus Cryptobacteroides gallistercoris TaxID=2840765 RepID=A0A940DLS2_9BACT|nr:hypothetical protein [Candidatus Cryptobacteroides gallistercoris]